MKWKDVDTYVSNIAMSEAGFGLPWLVTPRVKEFDPKKHIGGVEWRSEQEWVVMFLIKLFLAHVPLQI